MARVESVGVKFVRVRPLPGVLVDAKRVGGDIVTLFELEAAKLDVIEAA